MSKGLMMRLFRLDIQIVNHKIPKFETISLGKSLENVFVILQPIPLLQASIRALLKHAQK